MRAGAFMAPESATGRPATKCAQAWLSLGPALVHTATWTAPTDGSSCVTFTTAQATGMNDGYKIAEVRRRARHSLHLQQAGQPVTATRVTART